MNSQTNTHLKQPESSSRSYLPGVDDEAWKSIVKGFDAPPTDAEISQFFEDELSHGNVMTDTSKPIGINEQTDLAHIISEGSYATLKQAAQKYANDGDINTALYLENVAYSNAKNSNKPLLAAEAATDIADYFYKKAETSEDTKDKNLAESEKWIQRTNEILDENSTKKERSLGNIAVSSVVSVAVGAIKFGHWAKRLHKKTTLKQSS